MYSVLPALRLTAKHKPTRIYGYAAYIYDYITHKVQLLQCSQITSIMFEHVFGVYIAAL